MLANPLSAVAWEIDESVATSQIDVAVRVALEALEAETATPVEKIEML